jgi:hypothetical protein
MSARDLNSHGQPDALARGASHVIVGVAAAVTAGYVMVNLVNQRKGTPAYQLAAAGLAIWAHYELDLPVAKKLDAMGL